MKRRVIILVFLASLIAGFVFMLSLFDGPVRYLSVLPMILSVMFLPTGKTNATDFLKLLALLFLIYFVYCTAVLVLLKSGTPISKGWTFALILTVWAGFVRLVNTVKSRNVTS